MRQRAFSLLEMLIVLAIVAILATISVPTLRYFSDHTQGVVVQTQLLNMIQYARQTAKAMHLPIYLCSSNDAITCADDGAQGLWIVRSQTELLEVIQLPLRADSLHSQSYPFYRHEILFLSQGVNDNGTFWYCRAQQLAPIWAVILSHMGEMHLVYPNRAGK